ncbi:2-nitropropane dioxygenase [Stutzerimonas stutzeri]|uniref:Nitronate monooxygenase n=1 Tax=Stutzerimonas stutzeri TaxID=316 RepID=W8R2I6_STUST|nr:nitronate monooxygenase [Stutzerimonas stutzeri]AHL77090.1 2-nitropropane dioxygenase [Stutzerimonas stutzeri]MCQ4329970.1 nitronate monooxygenase [Stutzerimonas stutzeri]
MDIRDLFGIRLPIIQAPMAGSQNHQLAAAVSMAGGLGSIPAGMLNAETLDAELNAMAALTDRPYNVNFFCHQPAAIEPEREQAWLDLLAPFLREHQIDPASIPAGATRKPFDAAMAEVVERYRPAVVSFHFGVPAPELLQRVRATGAKILSSATTLEEGRWLQEQGVDAVIAQGVEAGGHRGMFLSEDIDTQVGTFALLPQLVTSLDVPVIAAGGIADTRGVAAARTLGAAGVQVGTAYLLCDESRTSALHRQALQSPGADSTVLTTLFSGRPARGMINRLIRELGPRPAAVPAFPLAGNAIGSLRATAEPQGISDFSPLWAGQNASGCQAIPAAQLTRALAAGWPD